MEYRSLAGFGNTYKCSQILGTAYDWPLTGLWTRFRTGVIIMQRG